MYHIGLELDYHSSLLHIHRETVIEVVDMLSQNEESLSSTPSSLRADSYCHIKPPVQSQRQTLQDDDEMRKSQGASYYAK